MENIKDQIKDYLSREKIIVKNFDMIDFYDPFLYKQLELIIKINKGSLDKWKYFLFMLNRVNKCNIADLEYKEGILNDKLIFKFRKILKKSDEDLLKMELEMFLNTLKKRFFTVRPTKEQQHILIKPTYRCNLDCKYCFDKPHRDKVNIDMSMGTLDRILRVASQSVSHLYLSFHGGEPTMVGTRWYEQAFREVISKYPMLSFKFDFVSNGTLLNDEWFELFKKHNIEVCVSYNANYQSDLRCSNQLNCDQEKEKNLGDRVEDIMRKHKTGVIDVVTKHNYKNMIDTYEFYKKLGKNMVAMKPVNENSQTSKYGLEMTAGDYIKEFLNFFEYWLYDKNGIGERTCINTLALVIGNNKHTNCVDRDCRKERFTINPLGDIYECDKYLPERYKCGNIFEIENFEEIYDIEGYRLYSNEIDERFNKICSKCAYFKFCYGCCHVSVIQNAGDGTGIDEFACESLKGRINGVYNVLRNIDSINYENINPVAAMIMRNHGFISVKEIRSLFEFSNYDIKLDYDDSNLLGCDEYKFFSKINHNKDNKHVRQNIVNFKKNRESNNEKLYAYYKAIV